MGVRTPARVLARPDAARALGVSGFVVLAQFAVFLFIGVALAAYAAYVINAAQFLLKLRAARRETGPEALAA